jgi:hypothetical protein
MLICRFPPWGGEEMAPDITLKVRAELHPAEVIWWI